MLLAIDCDSIQHRKIMCTYYLIFLAYQKINVADSVSYNKMELVF